MRKGSGTRSAKRRKREDLFEPRPGGASSAAPPMSRKRVSLGASEQGPQAEADSRPQKKTIDQKRDGVGVSQDS